MKEYKIAICDDDESFIRYLEEIITEVCKKPVDFYTYSSGEELIADLDEMHQLIVMDLVLGGMDGFTALKKVRERNKRAVLVYCTGVYDPKPEHFEVNPSRYLKKNYSDQRMEEELEAVFDLVAEIFDGKELHVRDKSGVIRSIPRSAITFIEKDKYGSIIHVTGETDQDKCYMVKECVPDLYPELSVSGFEWAHNSYVVNCRQVKQFSDKELTMSDGMVLTISRSKQKQFMKCMTKYWGGKPQ